MIRLGFSADTMSGPHVARVIEPRLSSSLLFKTFLLQAGGEQNFANDLLDLSGFLEMVSCFVGFIVGAILSSGTSSRS